MPPRRPRAGLRKRRAPLRRRGGRKIGRSRQSVRRAKQGLPKRQTMQSSLGGLTMTRFSAMSRPNSVAQHIKKTGAPNFINITYPGILHGPGGVQQYASWYLNTGNDLRKIWASIQNQYTQLNPATTAEYATTVGGVTTNQSFRYVLESAMSMLYLANTSGTPQNVELYDIVAKRDCGQVGLDMSGNLLAKGVGKFKVGQSNFLTPDTAWFLGMVNQQSLATGFPSVTVENVDPLNLGATPYQSKLFKDYFKVVRKTNVSLPIGGQHKHYVDLKPNRVIDGDMLSQNSVFKGLSFFTLVVASGVPVIKCDDADPTHILANPLGDATTSAVSLSIIQSVKYKWAWVEDTRENIYRANFINIQNTAGAQSIQPNYIKVYDADTELQVTGIGAVDSLLPSECTR